MSPAADSTPFLPMSLIAAWLRADPSKAPPAPESPAQWATFADAVIREGLAGILLDVADQSDTPIPEPIRLLWHREAARIANARRVHQETAAYLIRALDQAGMPAMLLKGAALSASLYHRPELRPSSDIDILVHPADAGRAVVVLTEHGCRKGAHLLNARFFPDHYYETELFATIPHQVRIDLHARPLRPLPYSVWLNDAEFWDDARAVALGPQSALIPSPENMLIHLAAHAAFHGGTRLLWLYDLKRWADAYRDEINWTLFVDRCVRWQLTEAVLTALDRAAERLGPIVPAVVPTHLVRVHSSRAERRILAQAPHDASRPIAHVFTNLLCTPGLRRRIRYAAALLAPGRNHLAGLYPFRHAGWPIFAAAARTLRAIGRILISPLHRLRRACA